MMESSMKKDIILNGTDSIAVFKEDGLVYRAKDLESYTPIVFNNLKANTAYYFDLQSVISKGYRVVDAVADTKDDDELPVTSTAEAVQASYQGVFLSTLRNNKRQSFQQFGLGGGQTFGKLFPISPLDKLTILCGAACNSVTLYCQPIYLEKTIIVPEVITNDPNNTTNA